jgi:hypothetical protein
MDTTDRALESGEASGYFARLVRVVPQIRSGRPLLELLQLSLFARDVKGTSGRRRGGRAVPPSGLSGQNLAGRLP